MQLEIGTQVCTSNNNYIKKIVGILTNIQGNVRYLVESPYNVQEIFEEDEVHAIN